MENYQSYDPREPYGQQQQQQQWQAPPPPQYQEWQAAQQPWSAQYSQYQGPMMAMDPPRNWLATILLCHFLGTFGVHRFYAGRIISGIFQLLTFGGFGIWALIDLIMIITGDFKDKYGRPLSHPPVMGGTRSWSTTALLCLFLGWLGVHRFYTGRVVSGIFQLLTFGGFGIWTLVDLIMIYTDSFTDDNGMLLTRMDSTANTYMYNNSQVKG